MGVQGGYHSISEIWRQKGFDEPEPWKINLFVTKPRTSSRI